MVEDFGLAVGTDVVIHDAASVAARDKRAAFAGVYLGGDPAKDLPAVEELLRSSAPVIPTVAPDADFASQIPRLLHFSNGLRRRSDDPEMNELAAALLECVGLLRKQRRAFISYRRGESRSAAMQLHDLLSARGFDVFLDTHDVRPGEPFQDVLWHRLCDSDVMLMLDTPNYFESKWTRQELGRARAKEIHVLRIVWPGHEPSVLTALADTIYLAPDDLRGADGPLIEPTANRLAIALERLRSKSIANDVANKASRADQQGIPILVYDHVGISDAWISHLQWLDDNIAAVRAIKSSEASWHLAGWE
jgi:hypothetical protein